MEEIFKYAIMTYEDTDEGTNIGDYIQSLAARQYLPSVDCFINREKLDEIVGSPTKLIMNGWFTHHPEHWIPSESIIPHFVAFHINHSKQADILTSKGIKYLKEHSPIGCRDKYTTNLLKQKGIDAYYSGCLTLTLDKNYKVDNSERNDEIYIVDPIFNIPDFKDHFKSLRNFLRAIKYGRFISSIKKRKILNKLIPKEIRKNAIYTHHMIEPNNLSEDDRFKIAENLLSKYARAKLVITSRIHCALPCLALGTPVIFINSFTDNSNKSRIEGLVDLFNHIDVDVERETITYSFVQESQPISNTLILPNPISYKSLAEQLKISCESFINKF